MENSKSAKICAYISLAISVVLMVLWICNVGGPKVVSLDTFVGVIVALLAIIVTVAIAWQIYNVIEVKNKVAELKQLETQLEKQKKSFEKFKSETTHKMYLIGGFVSATVQNAANMLICDLLSIELNLQREDPDDLEPVFSTMAALCKIEKLVVTPDGLKDIESINNRIRLLPKYQLIKGRYEPLYDEFISKVEKAGEQQ